MTSLQSLAIMLPGFLFTIIMHEYAHALIAYLRGDTTAKERLTFNPLNHLELWGSIIIPFINFSTGGFLFGWGRALVPKRYLLKKPFSDFFFIYLAGPLVSFFLGILFCFFLSFSFFKQYTILAEIFKYTALINFITCFFNLLPIPPLDGFFMLSVFLEKKFTKVLDFLIVYAPMIFIGFLLLSMAGLPILGVFITKPSYYCMNFFTNMFYKGFFWKYLLP
jgi:Zn-dependent protease